MLLDAYLKEDDFALPAVGEIGDDRCQKVCNKDLGDELSGPLLIYAPKRFTKTQRELCWEEPFLPALVDSIDYDLSTHRVEGLPLGAIVGRVQLVPCRAIGRDLMAEFDEQEVAFGEYHAGRWTWRLENPVEFKNPIQTKGSHGMWDFPDRRVPRAHGRQTKRRSDSRLRA